ncbi:hypothetical protein BCR32DRAFT_283261 [Anaeromyces robustus]|uniref:L domain-like protein n=1 Tax=Anaeromyces robustus TaxID=1754192 RepID=A0A1Y1WUW7_9FUNG|nr:hypothetical protein BCR32DRAFT_283261 [Anaeromyces robustus]|eukprot:ORX77340.1 hypothetical protein BCR32DRAFT_283261 [Anaeromyces robustus]
MDSHYTRVSYKSSYENCLNVNSFRTSVVISIHSNLPKCNSSDFLYEMNSKGHINSVTLKNQNFNDTNTTPSIITKITSLIKEKLIKNFVIQIGKLINFQELLLNNNSFHSVPSGIEQLNKLQIL